MYIRPGNSYYSEFDLVNFEGTPQNADTLPAASLVRNGAVDGAVTVTVSNVGTGLYKVSCVVPASYSEHDLVYVRATGEVDTVKFWEKCRSAVVWTGFSGFVRTVKGAGELNKAAHGGGNLSGVTMGGGRA